MRKVQKFLFLQGPHGSFFKLLARELEKEGHKTVRINFNGGDWIDYPKGIAYKHSMKMWPEWLYNFTLHNEITDIVLYGDCRPLHRLAILRLKGSNIKINVFEEGYIRPHWITYELDGVNGYSQIQEQINKIIEDRRNDQPFVDPFIPIKYNMRYMMRYCIRYYLFKWLGVLFYPRYKNHRPVNSLYEAIMWIKRFFILKLKRRFVLKKARCLTQSDTKYYLFLMQLYTDYQIREHSPYTSMKHTLIETIYSFAKFAPTHTKLVIKNHPLDSGQKNYGKLIKNICNELGISGRILYLDGGNLPELLEGSLAVVTVNSTAGLQAIHHKKPLKVLGTAIYNSEELVNKATLDEFWNNYKKPNQQAYTRFKNYLMRKNQINGSFYDPEGISQLLQQIVKKLCN